MELSFVSVLTLVTVVTATPHGYGVKGGASAKAEASAVAGALGPIPLSIPSGASYSGSFSKSSSSSFASSSASSSASSYSYSGSGTNDISGIGPGGPDYKGCSSGTCPGGAGNIGHLNAGQQFNGANAVAAAEARAQAGAYTPCQGSDCKGTPAEKCSTGKCQTDSELNVQNKCSTGNCASKSEKPSSETEVLKDCSSGNCNTGTNDEEFNNSNDFAVNINRNSQKKNSHDLNGQHFNKENVQGLDCSNGKCGPANFNPNSEASNQRQPPVPATHLTTPNLNQPCTSPNCNYPSPNSGSSTSGLPSSYNVPIQSATNPPSTIYSPTGSNFEPGKQIFSSQKVPSEPCTSPSCSSGSNIAGTYNIPNYHIGSQGPCASGRCDTHSSPNVKPSNYGVASGITSPNYLHGTYSSNVPSGHLGQPGCNTPNCSGLPSNQGASTEPKYTIPTYSSLPGSQQDVQCGGTGCATTSHTSGPKKPDHSDSPVYSGGFGGPQGLLDTTTGNKLPASTGQYNHYGPSQTPSSSSSGSFGHSPSHGSFGATKPNELNPVSQYSPSNTGSSPNGNYGSSPVQASFGPSQTPSFGGPTGGFGYNKPSGLPPSFTTQFNPSHTSSSGTPSETSIPLTSVTQPDNSAIHKPSVSNTAHTGSTGLSNSNSGSNSIHGSYGIPSTKPSGQNSPTYTGGFGGPTGGIDSSSYVGSTGNLKPGSGNCGLAGCSGTPVTGTNTEPISHDKEKPSSTSTSNQKKPAYTGGFGGPTGLLKPNDFGVPTNTPTSSSGNSPCTTGNCGSKDIYNHGHTASGAQSVASASANANAVAYSGGFGGPPGFLKPYDDGKVNPSAHGNRGSKYSSTFNDAHPDTNVGLPSAGDKNSLPGNSAGGANSGAHASATATASAGSYSGNGNHPSNNGGSGGCHSGCPNHGSDSHGGNEAGNSSIASAKSVAGANSYGFGGSFASSSASAHASAGAATKGGYDRK